jgi:DNA-binding NarL/FixJ family response regulator
MLKEISRQDAIQQYLDGDTDIQVLLVTGGQNQRYTMYNLANLLSKAKFLVETSSKPKISQEEKSEAIAKEFNLSHHSNGDVKAETEDEPDEDENTSEEGTEDTTSGEHKTVKKKPGRQITIDLGKLYSLRRAGWTIKNIAEELHCSVATVNKYVNNKELESEVAHIQKQNTLS